MKPLDLNTLEELAVMAEDGKKSSGEILVVYDENGNPKGTASRYICHRLGLLHKVIYLIVENHLGELLIQTRGDTKQGRLDVPVGGHLNIHDEDEIQALIREANEELALEVETQDVQFIFSYKRNNLGTLLKPNEKNHEIRMVYFMRIGSKSDMDVLANFTDRDEKEMVRCLEWMSVGRILTAIEDNRCADGLKETISHYLNWKFDLLTS